MNGKKPFNSADQHKMGAVMSRMAISSPAARGVSSLLTRQQNPKLFLSRARSRRLLMAGFVMQPISLLRLFTQRPMDLPRQQMIHFFRRSSRRTWRRRRNSTLIRQSKSKIDIGVQFGAYEPRRRSPRRPATEDSTGLAGANSKVKSLKRNRIPPNCAMQYKQRDCWSHGDRLHLNQSPKRPRICFIHNATRRSDPALRLCGPDRTQRKFRSPS